MSEETTTTLNMPSDRPIAAQPDLSHRQVGKNLVWNLGNFAIGLVSGVFLTPFLVRSLGVAAYGLIPLIAGLVQYFTMVTLFMSTSVSRFMTVAIGRDENRRAQMVFSTSLWGCGGLGIIVLVLGLTASFYTDRLLNIPAGYEVDARVIFQLATLGLAVTTAVTPFSAATFCTNRIDLNSWVQIANRILYLLISVLLVATVFPRPIAVAIASLSAALVTAVMAYRYWRKLMPWMRLDLGFDRSVLREQVTFGSWVVINNIGALLYLYMDLIVVNRMLGPVAGGQYAAIAQWSFLLRTMGSTVAAAFTPALMHNYARNDMDGLVRLARRSVRTMGLLLGLPIVLIAGFGRPLLHVWLGSEYAAFGLLLSLLVIHLCVNIGVTPLFYVQQATNRVRLPAIITCAMGIMNLLLSLLFVGPLHWGLFGVAASGAIMMTAKNAVFTPLYNAHILGRRYGTFLKELLFNAGLALGMASILYLVTLFVDLNTRPRLVLAGILASGVYAAFVWFFVLSAEEQTVLLSRLGFRPGSPREASSAGDNPCNRSLPGSPSSAKRPRFPLLRRPGWRALFLFLLLVNAVWIFGDLYPAGADWLARRGMGQIRDDVRYSQAVRTVALKWLRGTPPLEVRDHPLTAGEDLMELAARRNPFSNGALQFSWPQAVLAKGVAVEYQESQDTEALDALQMYLDGFLQSRASPDGKLVLRKLDEGMNGEIALVVFSARHDQRYLAAAEEIAEYYCGRAAHEGGTIAYLQPDAKGLRFVDALPMMCPFLARYGVTYRKPEAVELAVNQLIAFITNAVDTTTGLPFHAYDPAQGNLPVGLLGWGRGTGWYAVGLIDTLGALPKDHPQRAQVVDAVKRLKTALLRCQRSDGGWGALLTQITSRYDSSATALIAYFLQRSDDEGIVLRSDVDPAIARAVASLKDHTRRDGTVDFAQGSCMGFDRMSQRFAPTAYSQGMTLAVMATRLHEQPQ